MFKCRKEVLGYVVFYFKIMFDKNGYFCVVFMNFDEIFFYMGKKSYFEFIFYRK